MQGMLDRLTVFVGALVVDLQEATEGKMGLVSLASATQVSLVNLKGK